MTLTTLLQTGVQAHMSTANSVYLQTREHSPRRGNRTEEYILGWLELLHVEVKPVQALDGGLLRAVAFKSVQSSPFAQPQRVGGVETVACTGVMGALDWSVSQLPCMPADRRALLHCPCLSFAQDARLVKAVSSVTGAFIIPCCLDTVFKVEPIFEY